MSKTRTLAMDNLRAQVRLVDPRSTSDYESRRSELRRLDERAKQLGPYANDVRCEIGERFVTMCAYVGDLVTLREWAEVSIAWAQSVDEWGYCADLYAMLAVSLRGSSSVQRVDALTQAHEIRSTKDMDDEQASAVDNTIGAAFSNLGLIEEAQQRWEWSVDRYHDGLYPGVALCALNLSDTRLYLLENPHLRSVDDATPESVLSQIDRFNEILAQNPHCPDAVVLALRCRARLLRGDLIGARSTLDSVDGPLTSAMSWVQVLYARAKVAQTGSDVAKFVEYTELLLAHVGDHPVFVHLYNAAHRLHLAALLMAGEVGRASTALAALEGREQKAAADNLATLFDWGRRQSASVLSPGHAETQ